MRMPRFRFTVGRMMVAIAIFAISLVVGGTVAPDICRRWCNCREKADFHAAQAADLHRTALSRAIERAAARRYRLALWLPWRFYPLGDLSVENGDTSVAVDAPSAHIDPAETLTEVPAKILDAAR